MDELIDIGGVDEKRDEGSANDPESDRQLSYGNQFELTTPSELSKGLADLIRAAVVDSGMKRDPMESLIETSAFMRPLTVVIRGKGAKGLSFDSDATQVLPLGGV